MLCKKIVIARLLLAPVCEIQLFLLCPGSCHRNFHMMPLYNGSKCLRVSLQNKQTRAKNLSEFVTLLNCMPFHFLGSTPALRTSVYVLFILTYIANTTRAIRAAIQRLKADMHELKRSITSVAHRNSLAVMRLALLP